MKYRIKPQLIEAVRFDGSFTGPSGVQHIDDWIKSRDLTDCEVTCQGTTEPLALDVTSDFGIMTIEQGDYVIISEGNLSALKAARFEATYEPA